MEPFNSDARDCNNYDGFDNGKKSAWNETAIVGSVFKTEIEKTDVNYKSNGNVLFWIDFNVFGNEKLNSSEIIILSLVS